MDTIKSTYGLGGDYGPARTFIAGVELEIEDIQDHRGMDNSVWDQWAVTTDGSLRNNGREYISRPGPFPRLVEGFKRVHAEIIHSEVPEAFSERTSIHVHINCLELTQQQVKNIILYYALFENVFFAAVDKSRENNIHCVALTQTFLPAEYRRTVPVMVGRWHKYTALNLLPLATQGTIEFRHMEGHDNPIRFQEWLSILENLYHYGRTNNFTKALVLNNEALLAAFDAIFAGTEVHKLRGVVLNLIKPTLLDVKLAF